MNGETGHRYGIKSTECLLVLFEADVVFAMDHFKRALQPYFVAALAAATLGAQQRIQAAMWRSKRRMLMLAGGGIFLYGVGSATPGALVALLARDHAKHSGEPGVGGPSTDVASELTKIETIQQGWSMATEQSKLALEKIKKAWTAADVWISERDEEEPAGAGAQKKSSLAMLWQRLTLQGPSVPINDPVTLSENSEDPFKGMDEAWAGDAADVPPSAHQASR
jgi:hypothetical protein